MKTLQERLILALQQSGLTQTDIWKGCGLTSGTVSQWINKPNTQIKGENLLCAAKILGVNPRWLSSGIGPMREDGHDQKINYPRVVGTARCGNEGYYLDLEGGDGYLEFEAEPGSIAIRIRGDSMHPAIRDGWYVVIEPSGKPAAGEYVLLKFKSGRNMVKELLQEKSDCYVVMSVSNGDRITAMKDELHDIHAISAVIPPSKHKEW
jgi:phage repressor protein C with HTH and peptisase S24 domain